MSWNRYIAEKAAVDFALIIYMYYAVNKKDREKHWIEIQEGLLGEWEEAGLLPVYDEVRS